MNRFFDISAKVEPQADGSHKLTITATGLTLDQATRISDGCRAPFREVVVDVLTNGGRIQHMVVADDGGETRQ